MGTVFTYNGMTFRDNAIIEGSIQRTKSPINADFQYDTFDIVIKDENMDGVYLIDSQSVSLADSSGELLQGWGQEAPTNFKAFVRGTAGRLTKDNQFIGEFYINSVERIAEYEWRLNFISALGLLDTIPHKGGVYAGVSMCDIIVSILGGTLQSTSQGYEIYTGGIFPYKLQTTMRSTSLSGWLPYTTSARENLHQVLFATGASLVKDTNGIRIEYWIPDTAIHIGDERIYVSGKSVDYQSRPTKVVITEHEYRNDSQYAQSVELFKTQNPVSNKLVVFTEPCYDLSWSGSSMPSSGANYAIVNGSGTLTGKKYSHNTNTIEKVTGVEGKENIFSVTDMTLVSTLNSTNVAERVASYYANAEIVSYGIKVTGDASVGDRIRFTDPFGEQIEGYISEEDLNLSAVIKSDTKIVTNWSPNHIGNAYNYQKIFRNVGDSFTPNASQVGTQAKLIIFSGFQGGQGGGGSTDGTGGATLTPQAYSTNTLESGSDGTAGSGGVGGTQVRINEIIFTLQNQAYTLTQRGTGGAGGAGGGKGQNGSYGSIGGETVVAGYSSSGSGSTIISTGYSNPLTGEVYGGSSNGYEGGNVGESKVYNNVTYTSGANGATHGGEWGWRTGVYFDSYGSHGGGAYPFSNGINGNDGDDDYPRGGNGVNSVTPTAPTKASFGRCGDGGHGSPAPTGGGGCYESCPNTILTMYQGAAGLGANGSAGGQGADGFAILLYK